VGGGITVRVGLGIIYIYICVCVCVCVRSIVLRYQETYAIFLCLCL